MNTRLATSVALRAEPCCDRTGEAQRHRTHHDRGGQERQPDAQGVIAEDLLQVQGA